MAGKADMVGSQTGSAETILTAVSPKSLRLWQGTCMGFSNSFPAAVFKRKLTGSCADGSDAKAPRTVHQCGLASPQGVSVSAGLITCGCMR